MKRVLITGMLLASVFRGYADRLYGLERMERLDLLPCLLDGARIRQVSSHDRTGANDDGYYGTYSALYIDEHGDYVLFDDMGPGCIYRMWTTFVRYDSAYATGRFRFYFDNEETPRIDLALGDFYNGIGAPLEFPLTGPFDTSSLGCYSYLPIPYRERLKITLSGMSRYYNFTYHKFDSTEGITSWTGTEDHTAVLEKWNAVGTDPKPSASNLLVSGSSTLAPGGELSLFAADGAGVIQSIRIDPAPASQAVLSGVRIRMNWDGGEPEVDVPIGDFFGSGKGEITMTSLMIGMYTSTYWYCYFPMPYWESAAIDLVNPGGATLSNVHYEVQYATNQYDRAAAGSFHAAYKKQTLGNDGTDYIVIDEQGRGHVVGVSLFMQSPSSSLSYLEGDERIYIDGSLSPCVYGTGNEDYFNGGWYFGDVRCSLPQHGNPVKNGGEVQAYRLHLSDLIPFSKSIRFGIEHGVNNASAVTFASVAYYYLQENAGLLLAADLDLGDAWAEEVYGYTKPTEAVTRDDTWRYEGDNDHVNITDRGYVLTNGMSEFTVPLPERSAGLLLRRRSDQGIGGQAARVYVDEVPAGIWYEGDHNFAGINKRWIDSEFMISSNLLAGKTSTRIAIEPLSGSWNEYRYQAFCIKPFEWIEDSDHDRLPDGYEINLTGSLTVLDGSSGADRDGDGFSDHAEFEAGTHPTNPASYFAMDGWEYGFDSVMGRLYRIEECDDLRSNSWITVRSGIPGTGGPLRLPVTPDHPASYHRLQVEMQ